MALKTGRADASAEVFIDTEKCTGCGLCATACGGVPLSMRDGAVHVDQDHLWGCMGCGHCMVYCPTGAIEVRGRDLVPEDILDLPKPDQRAGYEQLLGLLLARRSMRHFTEEELGQEVVDRILEAASTAPMGLPPTDVEVLVLRGRERVQAFVGKVMKIMARSGFLFTRPMLWLMRPFWGKAAVDQGRDFVGPFMKGALTAWDEGRDLLFYDAPLVLYFHGSPYCDQHDMTIAATYGMLAGQALGLGTCMIGSAAPFVKTDKKLMREYGIARNNRHGIAVIFGRPALKPQRALRRRFARVHEG